MQYLIEVVKAAIDKSYSEGYWKWTKQNLFNRFLDDVDLNDPRIQNILRKWEKDGIIRFVGKDDCYFEVLKYFP